MISTLEKINPPELPGVTIGYLDPDPTHEVALVTIEAHGTIPLHSHTVDAQMTIVAGNARVLSDDEDNGREVTLGDCVFFRKNRVHGFIAGAAGLTFLSRNGGIRQPDGTLNMAFA